MMIEEERAMMIEEETVMLEIRMVTGICVVMEVIEVEIMIKIDEMRGLTMGIEDMETETIMGTGGILVVGVEGIWIEIGILIVAVFRIGDLLVAVIIGIDRVDMTETVYARLQTIE